MRDVGRQYAFDELFMKWGTTSSAETGDDDCRREFEGKREKFFFFNV